MRESPESRGFIVSEYELVDAGAGNCTAYLGIVLPPKPSRSGFVPVLPAGMEDKKGIFVQYGTAKCSIVMNDFGSAPEPTVSFISNGGVSINEQIGRARGDTL